MHTTPKKILICRTDKLGDFVLSLPSFILLKKALPNTKLIALTQEYTKPIAELCDSIDEIITIPKSSSKLMTILNTVKVLKQHNIDTSISLFTTSTVAISLLLSSISYRFAPATKIDQIFYNFKLRQSRSKSLKPEFEYNIDLIKYYLDSINVKCNRKFNRPVLKFDKEELIKTKKLFCSKYNISTSEVLIFIHVGSGGSANNLSTEQFALLINKLATTIHAVFVLCEGPEDSDNVTKTIKSLKSVNYIQYISNNGLLEFTKNIAIANFFISGSTGPLHIAGALDIPTAGFYPNRRSATLTRWKTINSENNLIGFSPPDNTDDMSTIDIEYICNKIHKRLNI